MEIGAICCYWAASSTIAGGTVVFRSLQDHRLPAVAEQFFDRARPSRCDPAVDAVCEGRAQADGVGDCAACDLRVLAARQFPALSAGAALSEMGRFARRA